MKNQKNPSKLKCLLPVTITAFAFGLSFITSSAQAFSIVLKTSLSQDPIAIVNNNPLDLDRSQNTIRFHQVRDGLDIKGTLQKSIIEDLFIPDVGTEVNGFFLNLTELEITNIGNNTINLGFNNRQPNNIFLVFSDRFSFFNPSYASQLLDGSFNNGGLINTVTLRGRAYGTLIANQTVPRGSSRFNLPSNPKKIIRPFNDRVSGNLRALTLRPDSQLRLPNSACTLVLDTPVNGEQTKRICQSIAVPEPSSVISLLALGVFGGGFLLKRQRKSSSKQ